MDLVYKKDISWLKVGQNRGEIAGLLDDRARGRTEPNAEFQRHDLREGRFPEAGRTMQQHMVQCLPPAAGGLNEDREILPRCLLAGEFRETTRPKRRLHRVFFSSAGGDGAILSHRARALTPPAGRR